MSDEVEVPFGGNASDNAVLLLAAAQELGLGSGVVKTREGMFVVPKAVHDKAFQKEEPKKKSTAKRAKKK